MKGLCLPLIIYIVLCLIGIILQVIIQSKEDKKIDLSVLLSNVCINILFALLIYVLCYNGLVAISWVILLMPFIMTGIFLVMFGGGMILSLLHNKKKE